MVKIRLHGLEEEIRETKKQIEKIFVVNSESELYQDRGKSNYVRMYLDVELKGDNEEND